MKMKFIPALALASFLVPVLASAQNPTPVPPAAPAPEDTLDRLNSQMEATRAVADRLQAVVAKASPFGPSGPGERSLYVAASTVDEKVQNEIEEDLNIMGHLIEKAVADVSEDRGDRRAMGIRIQTALLGNAAHNLQIDGYGALFEASVPFPLAPTAEEAQADQPKGNTNSAWEEARRELSGGGEGLVPGIAVPPPDQMKYDAAKVEALKTALIDALGNANNMRHLQSTDFITVVVHSGGEQRFNFFSTAGFAGPNKVYASGNRYKTNPSRPGGVPAGGGISTGVSRDSRRSGGESLLTIRVKKSDVDALAKGELKPEDFRKRTLVVIN